MNLLESIAVNFIFILFPLFCYFLFLAYEKSCGKKTNDILFDLAIYTSLYLTLKYGIPTGGISVMIVIIPLLIAYLRRKLITALIMSIIIGTYYYLALNYNLLVVVVEFVMYGVTFWYLKNKKLTDTYFIDIFVIIKVFFIIFEFNYQIFKDMNIFNILIVSTIFYFVCHFICFLLKKCEETMNFHMTMKALEKQKQLRDSLFKITHEIKNPIAVCKGYLDMFDIDNKEHTKRYIPIIKQEINRTLTLMSDFLNLTSLKVELTDLDISVVIPDVCDSLQLLIKSHNIDFKCEMFDKEVYIKGDYDRLKQVFINLIKNSIEAIPKGKKGVIKLTAKQEKRGIVITIEDNGIGIDKENLLKVGESFFTTKKNGTGLGVRFSKEIIEAHKGTITYKSKKDLGTTVIITIPVIKNPKIL